MNKNEKKWISYMGIVYLVFTLLILYYPPSDIMSKKLWALPIVFTIMYCLLMIFDIV